MSDRYIKLSFENAKLFPKNIKTKDFVGFVDVNHKGKLFFNKISRGLNEVTSFKEPITVHQISNVLHVLTGERPVPSFRKTFYKRDEFLFDLAKKSLLKIHSPKTLKNIKGENVETYIDEFTKVNKSAWNSWSNQPSIQWFKIKKYMGDNYDEFIKIINDSLGYDVTTKPFEELSNICNKKNVNLNLVIEYLNSINKTPIINFLNKEVSGRSEITRHVSSLGETITSGIDIVNNINGEVLIPYNQSFIDRLTKNSANILDGGVIKIIGVFYEDELNETEDFILMSDITDEKY
jgi:hypothetical protein